MMGGRRTREKGKEESQGTRASELSSFWSIELLLLQARQQLSREPRTRRSISQRENLPNQLSSLPSSLGRTPLKTARARSSSSFSTSLSALHPQPSHWLSFPSSPSFALPLTSCLSYLYSSLSRSDGVPRKLPSLDERTRSRSLETS